MENNLTRKQKRYAEMINVEAKEVYSKLTAKFLEFFIYSDNPESQEVVNKMDEIDRKWKVYCHQKNLNIESYGHIEKYMQGVVKQYSEINKKDGISA